VKLTEEQTNMMDKIFKTFNLRKEWSYGTWWKNYNKNRNR
jgi:hypothetical protein